MSHPLLIGALIGLPVGALLAIAYMLSTGSADSCSCDCPRCGKPR